MAGERRVEPWPVALAGALLAMICVCLGFYAIAATHPDPEVVDDAYEAGLRINEELRARRRAAALGVVLALETRREPGGVEVRVTVTDARGAPAAAERVAVRRERPAEGGLDADFELARSGGGYAGLVPLPRPGRWRLVATATVGGEVVRRVFSLEGV